MLSVQESAFNQNTLSDFGMHRARDACQREKRWPKRCLFPLRKQGVGKSEPYAQCTHSIALVHHHIRIRVDQGHELLERFDELPAQWCQGVFDLRGSGVLYDVPAYHAIAFQILERL